MVSDEIGSSTYVNSNIVLMDRNIGALSATLGDPLSMGLLYQWGRKDPFLTACEFYDGDVICIPKRCDGKMSTTVFHYQ